MSALPSAETPAIVQGFAPSAANHAPRQTQMNVRMSASLKADGDAALAQAGYTPSAAVRALWAFAASHAAAPQEIASLLESTESTAKEATDSRIAHRLALIAEGPRAIESYRHRFNANASAFLNEDETYDDLIFDALTERMRERGTL